MTMIVPRARQANKSESSTERSKRARHSLSGRARSEDRPRQDPGLSSFPPGPAANFAGRELQAFCTGERRLLHTDGEPVGDITPGDRTGFSPINFAGRELQAFCTGRPTKSFGDGVRRRDCTVSPYTELLVGLPENKVSKDGLAGGHGGPQQFERR